ncbi:MAG: response regulator [Burkholderiaceae bacterium]|nr:response regulator [Burkholderiaceae bacterium]
MPAAHPTAKLRILLADDDEFMQQATIIMLQSLGHTGVAVDDGAKALACLAQRSFDIVLLDIMMPEMDGLACLAAIRQAEQLSGRHQRIIMLTGHAEPSDAQRLKKRGADGYIAKPLNISKLAAELSRVVGHKN